MQRENKSYSLIYIPKVVDGTNDFWTSLILGTEMAAKEYRDAPTAVILHTVKGAGVSKYANMQNCHSVSVTQQDLAEALAELDG